MGLLGGLFKVVGFLVLVLVGLGAYLYFVDYEVEATITEKGQDAKGHYIVLTPTTVPYHLRTDLDPDAARFVCEDYRVTYRLQSGYTEVYDRQGRLVWDSENGVNDTIRTLLTTC